MRAAATLAPLVLGAALAGAATADSPALSVAPAQSRDGVYRASWSGDGEVLIEEARDPSFADPRAVYRGADGATVFTGRADGTWYYRARVPGEPDEVSDVASVTVEHHSLARALAFFGVGLAVFLATVALVLRGPDTAEAGRG